MQLGVDLTALSKSQREALMKVCTDANAMEMVQAKVRQERIARFYRDNPPRAIEGIGGITCSIDPYLMSYFRMKYQWDAEEEGEAKEWLMKRNEELRVRHAGLRVQVGYGGVSDGAAKRFRKKY